MEHPDLNILIQRWIHEDMIRRATLARRIPAAKSVNRIRVVAGGTLMAIGARIAATPRTLRQRPTIGEMPIVGSTRNT